MTDEVAKRRTLFMTLPAYSANTGWEVKLRAYGDAWEIVTRHDKLLAEHSSRSILANKLRKAGYGPIHMVDGTWKKKAGKVSRLGFNQPKQKEFIK